MSNALIFDKSKPLIQETNLDGQDEFYVELLLENFDPVVVEKIQRIARRRGIALKTQQDADNAADVRFRLFTDFNEGRTVSGTVSEFNAVLSNAKNEDVNFDDLPEIKSKDGTGALVDLDLNNEKSVQASNALINRKKSFFIRTDNYNSSQFNRYLEEVMSNPSQIDAALTGGVSDNTIESLLDALQLEKRIAFPSNKEITSTDDIEGAKQKEENLLILFKVIRDLKELPDQKLLQFRNLLLSKITQLIFQLRLKRFVNKFTQVFNGSGYDLRKFSTANFNEFFQEFISSDEDDRAELNALSAYDLRALIAKLPEDTDENKARKKLAQFLAYPKGASPVERGRLPFDGVLATVNRLNSAEGEPRRLARLLNIVDLDNDELDPKVRILSQHLQIISLFDPLDNFILNLIYKSDLSLRQISAPVRPLPANQDDWTVEEKVRSFFGNNVIRKLYREANNNSETIETAEAFSLIEYVYSSTDPQIDQYRNQFLADFLNNFADGANRTDRRRAVLSAIIRVRNQMIEQNDTLKQQLVEFELNRVKKALTQAGAPFNVATIPAEVSAGGNPKELTLKVINNGKSENASIDPSTGSVAALSNLYLQDKRKFAEYYVDLNHDLDILTSQLKASGIFQNIAALLHNGSDVEVADNESRLISIFNNLTGSSQAALKRVEDFFIRFIPDAITTNPATRQEIAKYLASRFMVDVLSNRTRVNNLLSRTKNIADPFANESTYNLPAKVREILRLRTTITAVDRQLNLNELSQTERSIVLFELKKAEIQRQLIEKFKQDPSIDVVTAQAYIRKAIDYLMMDIDAYKVSPNYVGEWSLDPSVMFELEGEPDEHWGEKTIVGDIRRIGDDMKRREIGSKFRAKLTEEFSEFTEEVFGNPLMGERFGYQFKNLDSRINDSVKNLYVVLNGKSQPVEVSVNGRITLKNVKEAMVEFIRVYSDRIGQIEISDTGTIKSFESSITTWRSRQAKEYVEEKTKAANSGTNTDQQKTSYKQQITAEMSKLNIPSLQEFVTDRLAIPGISVSTIIEILVFVKHSSNYLKDLNKEQITILFHLISGDPADQYNLDSTDPTNIKIVDDTNAEKFDKVKTLQLAKTIFKNQQAVAIQYYKIKKEISGRAVELEKKVAMDEQANKPKDTSAAATPTTVRVLGREVTLNEKPKGLLGGLVAKAKSIPTGVTTGGMGAVSKLFEALDNRNNYDTPNNRKKNLENRKEEIELLSQAMSDLPTEVRTVTNNLLLAEIAKDKITTAEADLKRIREVIYPALKRNIASRRERKEIQDRIDLNRISYAKTAIEKAYAELEAAINQVPGTPVEAEIIEKRLAKLINNINTAMLALINDVEQLSVLSSSNRNMSAFRQLQEVNQNYVPGRNLAA